MYIGDASLSVFFSITQNIGLTTTYNHLKYKFLWVKAIESIHLPAVNMPSSQGVRAPQGMVWLWIFPATKHMADIVQSLKSIYIEW